MEEYNIDSFEIKKSKVTPEKKMLPFTKILLFLGLGLLITGIVSFSIPQILFTATNDPNVIMTTSLVLMIVSSIISIPLSFVVMFKAMSPKMKVSLICYIVYAICIGVLLSSVFIYLLWEDQGSALSTIAISFFITAGCFILMGLFGAIFKKNLNSILWPILLTACIGTLILTLVNFFFFNDIIYWITDFVIFGVILLITAIDFNNINRLIKNKNFSSLNSMCIYCAFMLYSDFILIFIRVLYFVMRFREN